MTTPLSPTQTPRLLLTRPQPDDLAELFALHADPDSWRHLPSGRHRTREDTEQLLRGYEQSWAEHGLGAWVARRRGGPEDGALVGVGGCSLRGGVAWNLYYRLTPACRGQGLAQEIIAAALPAARRVRPELPVVAYLVEHNTGSKAAAERAGLVLRWRGPDAGNPDPDAVRLVYADRALAPAVLESFTG
ncbi:N-acetyltransferase [Desertihabitans brevis]|uniref:N-acetyltransferase n=1 Tax=Desertihabitans brevis TaxID=2268447 RepID=A0A367YUJ8_9ACTN|nr:GNAT family N-acetyltransferase [Desertihabitans brevis]RCK69470.1 N-acetyltransferase [Desertihabitans brevis]